MRATVTNGATVRAAAAKAPRKCRMMAIPAPPIAAIRFWVRGILRSQLVFRARTLTFVMVRSFVTEEERADRVPPWR